ncbi:hypothetical protein IT418_00440 [bacterium]|nr:hypothetical protein [bacterium]
MWKLEKNWRGKLISSYSEIGYKLIHLLESTSGSILISGDRGTGKTHLIQTLSEKKQKDMVFIWLNTIKIGAIKDEGDDGTENLNMLSLLKFLIEELSCLDLPNKKVLMKIKKDLYVTERGLISGLNMSVSNTQMGPGYQRTIQEKWQGYTTAQLSSKLANYLQKVKAIMGSTGLEKLIRSIQDFFIGIWNAVLRFFKTKTERIVFVFDELDDIRDVNKLLDLIKKFKNLFTRSGISFVFITSSNAFEKVKKLDSTFNSGDEDKYRTLFTDIVYLRRYALGTLSDYIKDITTERSPETDALITYFGIEAKGNIYNLKRNLSTRESFFEDHIELRYEDIDMESVHILNYVFKIGELIIKTKNEEPYVEDLLYMTLFEYVSDLWLYLSNYNQTDRKTRAELKQRVMSFTVLKRHNTEVFANEFFETLSQVITSKPNGINYGDEQQVIAWGDIKDKIDSSVDVEDLSWRITPLHRGFLREYSVVSELVKEVFKQKDLLQSQQLRNHQILNDGTYDELKLALDQGTLTVKNGNAGVTERGLAILNDIKSKVSNFWDFSSGILLRKDSGGIDFDLQNHVVKLSQANRITEAPVLRLYTHLLDGKYKRDFDIEFTVKSDNNQAILDVLFYDTPQYTNAVTDSYYIVRITTQSPPEQFMRTGILIKNSVTTYEKAWYVTEPPETPRSIPQGEDTDVRIRLNKGKMELYSKPHFKQKYSPKDMVESWDVGIDTSFHHIVTTNQNYPFEIKNILKKK